MSIKLIHHCSVCGISSEKVHVGTCTFCDKPVCTNCASWIPARQTTIHGIYHTVNRVCPECNPKRK